MIDLKVLLELSEVSPVRVDGDASVFAIVSDSRRVEPGAMFVCMPGLSRDTHEFLSEARTKGAKSALVFSESGFNTAKELGMTAVQLSADVPEFYASVGLICREFYSDPTLDMRVIGVTGTNGKTTVAWLLQQALGPDAAYMGTLGLKIGGKLTDIGNTTPFPTDLWEALNEARSKGVTHFVMEVSSHSLDQKRIEGVRFDLGLFTNLSQDHLDYHGSMEAYKAAKLRLFEEVAEASEQPFVAVINADDPVGQEWIARWEKVKLGEFAPLVLSYGFQAGTVRGTLKSLAFDSLELGVKIPEGEFEAKIGVGGKFNAENCLAVFAAMAAIGRSPSELAKALSAAKPVPGRFESITNTKGIGVIVDYAHTDDALEKLLESGRDLNPGKMICVFGCGGDRDRTKRPKMAGVSTRLADHTVFTSDNPRTEDPAQIMADLLSGAREGSSFEVITDRQAAIQSAIEMAERGDLVVIAGKGHEDYQIIGREKLPFDDRIEALRALSSAVGKA